MNSQVGKCDRVVVLAEAASRLSRRHKVCETDQEVDQDENSSFIECLYVIIELRGEGLVPLQVNAQA